MRSTSIAIAAALTLAAGTVLIPSHSSAKMNMEQMEMAAKTPADHRNLAKHYEDMAAEARDKANMHRKMAQDYRKEGGAIVSKLHFDEHCDALVKMFLAEAEEYDALAKAHLEMAKE